MFKRTFGWIQNPSDFSKLKKTVQIFDSSSDHYQSLKNKLIQQKITHFNDTRNKLQKKFNDGIENFNYLELVGTSTDKNGKSPEKRKFAEANSLIQISWLPQQSKRTGKNFTDNWTSDGFLRWAVTLNFVKHDRETDYFSITDLGKEFSKTPEDSEEEKEKLTSALLSYPPATQILNLLNNNPGYHTKFSIGEQLGFRGEKGFTSYDESMMIDWLKNSFDSKERTKIKRDVEGTSDKYARMICTWLKKLNLVTSHAEKINKGTNSFSNFLGYSITGKGKHTIQQANGFSKNNRKKKYIMWEFLATEGKNRDYIRTRRAFILKFLQETKSFNSLLDKMQQKGFYDDENIIKTDINGLKTFGIHIEKDGNTVDLKDLFNNFVIPNLKVTDILQDQETEKRKAEFMRKTNLPAKYIELLDIAYDGTRNRDFEIITMELFRKVYGLNSILLGGGRKPDGLIFTNNFGVIIDTKAYKDGYSKSINQADQMIRYIEDNRKRDIDRNPTEWWVDFNHNIPDNRFYFMWISSNFIGKFHEQLEYTSSQTNTRGGSLNVEQLLLGADSVSKGYLNINNLPDYINNKEIMLVTE